MLIPLVLISLHGKKIKFAWKFELSLGLFYVFLNKLYYLPLTKKVTK